MNLTAGNYVTIAVILGGIIGNWYLMQDHIQELQDDMDALSSSYHEFRVDDAKREAEEASADAILALKVETIQRMFLK